MNLRPVNKGVLSSWWWTIDRITLFTILLIISSGIILIATSSPYVAKRIGVEDFHFIYKQITFLSLSLIVIFSFSLLNPVIIKRISLIGFILGILALILVLAIGDEIKGAKRWINIIGISIQPSEFVKPFFIVVTAWLLSINKQSDSNIAYKIMLGCYLLLTVLLVIQPDFGMTILTSLVFGGQLFLGGLPLIYVVIFSILFIIGVIAAYNLLPHVQARIDSFLNPEEKSYQVRKSLEAVREGGLFGKGPGEGTVKQYLPDSHTDFIFSVAAEELGIIFCAIIVVLFATIVIRSFLRVIYERDLFILYASFGLVLQFGLQSVVNMGVALDILPTKGMTLPFISYGGSSVIALSISIGMILCLTRKRYGTTMLRQGI